MTALAEKTRYTPEDLLTMPDGDQYELVGGELIEKTMTPEAGWISRRLFDLLVSVSKDVRAGWVLPPDAGYQCFPQDPDRVRRPDLSFIRRERLPDEDIPYEQIRIAPDLAVEIVPPHALYVTVNRRKEDYLVAGARVLWIVDVKNRNVLVYRGREGFLLDEDDELSGEDVLPGFRCRVGDLFPPQSAPAGQKVEDAA